MAQDINANTDESGRRFFEIVSDGESKRYYLDMPTSDQVKKAEWHYSKIYNKALVDGVATTSEMLDILTKRGIYGKDYEKKLNQLHVDIALKIAEMGSEQEQVKKERLAHEVRELRNDLYAWNQRITGPLSNSCERMAEDAKTEYLTSAIIRDADGKNVWSSYEAFLEEENRQLALKARLEVLLWLEGLDSDFLDKTPENMVIQEMNMRRIKERDEAAKKEPAQLKAAEEQLSDNSEDAKPSKSRRARAKKNASE